MSTRIFVSDSIHKIDEVVHVAGWVHSRRDHGKIIFIDLRDRSGILQVVFAPKSDHANRTDKSDPSTSSGQDRTDQAYRIAERLRSEWVIEIEGIVRKRPEGMVNPDILTGGVELEALGILILSEAKTPPFEISEAKEKVGEEIRLKYRYLDLRREKMKQNLFLRDRVITHMRIFLHEKGFLEIETPILTKSTPEGARDFIVPSRLQSGKFYALPQSPQQYKQLLMVAGVERYFQIARCFRDEDTRGDRQAEFTQLDLEMSFVEQEDILELTEDLFIEIVKHVAPEEKISQIPFPRLTFQEVINRYGTDRPDLRKNPRDSYELAFAWITDFPMFEWRDTERRWDTVHHPFTKIKNPKSTLRLHSGQEIKNDKEFIQYIKEHPATLLAEQYDLVLNGYEIGGGSIREHNPKVLEAVFEILGHTKEETRAKFGHLLEAFEYGVPPHGGIAPGIDRFTMILAGEPNIREVIAFPKTGDGSDVMMGAPSNIDPKQLEELHIKIASER